MRCEVCGAELKEEEVRRRGDRILCVLRRGRTGVRAEALRVTGR